MTAPLLWTLLLAAAVLALLATVVRRTLRRAGGRSPTTVVKEWLERLRGPVALDTLPRHLVDQAIRETKPVPGGRALPDFYRLRCGSRLYADVHPFVAELRSKFSEGLQYVAEQNGWRTPDVELRVELDESLLPDSYRLDGAFRSVPRPGVTALGPGKKATTIFHEWGSDGGRRPHESDWYVSISDTRSWGVPPDRPLVIGYDQKCTIAINNQYVSGVHVTLVAKGENLVVHDGDGNGRSSTNGTRLDGIAIATTVLTPDVDKAVLQLGPEVRLTITRFAATRRLHP